MKRRFFSIVLALLMVFSLTACASDSKDKDSISDESDYSIDEQTDDEVADDEEDTIDDAANEVSDASNEADEEKDDKPKDVLDLVKTPKNKTDRGLESSDDADNSSDDALLFAANLKVGWNLGNTLDAYDDSANNTSGTKTETYWGNPVTTKAMIDTIKEQGFTTIRIPVSYHDHVYIENNKLRVSEEWLNRVKEIVDYAIEDDLYVIINLHHDNIPVGGFGYIPDYDNKDQALWYVKGVWSEVAPFFKDYDEHLIFEGLNEPRLTNDPENEWWYNTSSTHCKEAAEVINELNQEFVNIVRASGGNNTERYLMVSGYCASVSGLTNGVFKIPEDSADNKIMISVHSYVPYDFALNPDMSLDKFDVNAAEADLGYLINQVRSKFINKGIPVVIGEFGCMNKNNNLSDRIAYYEFYVSKCAENGIPCCVWDNGIASGSGELFGLLDRKKCKFYFPEIADAIVNSYK